MSDKSTAHNYKPTAHELRPLCEGCGHVSDAVLIEFELGAIGFCRDCADRIANALSGPTAKL